MVVKTYSQVIGDELIGRYKGASPSAVAKKVMKTLYQLEGKTKDIIDIRQNGTGRIYRYAVSMARLTDTERRAVQNRMSGIRDSNGEIIVPKYKYFAERI